MRDPAAMSDSSSRIAEARHTRALRGFTPSHRYARPRFILTPCVSTTVFAIG
jgi:hypothetical protein